MWCECDYESIYTYVKQTSLQSTLFWSADHRSIAMMFISRHSSKHASEYIRQDSLFLNRGPCSTLVKRTKAIRMLNALGKQPVILWTCNILAVYIWIQNSKAVGFEWKMSNFRYSHSVLLKVNLNSEDQNRSDELLGTHFIYIKANLVHDLYRSVLWIPLVYLLAIIIIALTQVRKSLACSYLPFLFVEIIII